MPELDEKRLEHMQQLIGLVIRYVLDCAGCAEGDCPLLIEITEHTSDLPALPSGLTICNLLDYISQNAKDTARPREWRRRRHFVQ